MNGLVTVPAELVGELRSGLRLLLGDAAAAMLQASELGAAEQRREAYVRPRRLLGQVCDLLDRIGWEERGGAQAIQIDLGRHHRALSLALRSALIVAEDELAEARAPGAAGGEPDAAGRARAAEAHVRAMRGYLAAIERLRARLPEASGSAE